MSPSASDDERARKAGAVRGGGGKSRRAEKRDGSAGSESSRAMKPLGVAHSGGDRDRGNFRGAGDERRQIAAGDRDQRGLGTAGSDRRNGSGAARDGGDKRGLGSPPASGTRSSRHGGTSRGGADRASTAGRGTSGSKSTAQPGWVARDGGQTPRGGRPGSDSRSSSRPQPERRSEDARPYARGPSTHGVAGRSGAPADRPRRSGSGGPQPRLCFSQLGSVGSSTGRRWPPRAGRPIPGQSSRTGRGPSRSPRRLR